MRSEKEVQRTVSSGPGFGSDNHGLSHHPGDSDDFLLWAAIILAAATDDCVAAAMEDYHRLVGGANLSLSAVGPEAEQDAATDPDR